MSETTTTPLGTPTGKAALRREIATIGTDPNRWLYGGRMLPEDAILASRGQGKGLWLYDELERDPHVGTELAKRKDALIGREWQVLPADDSAAAKEAADLVTTTLQGLAFSQAVAKFLDAVLKGVSFVEVMWAVQGNALVPTKLLHRDPRRFGFHAVDGAGPELRLLTRLLPLDGEPVPDRKFIVHRHGSRYESPWGRGLGERLFWPVFFKRQGIGFWLSALEKFGQPTVVGKYPAGTTDTEQANLLAAMQAAASEAAVAIPEGMVMELLEAKRAGTFDAYESLARYMDEDISKVIVGQTLTTQAGTNGSRALGQVHDAVRLEITKADADNLSDTLNGGLLRWIVDLNRPGLPYPKLWWDVSIPDDMTARADRDTKIYAMGFDPMPDYITETYGKGWMPRQASTPPGNAPAPALATLFAEAGRRARKPSTMPPAVDPRDTADMLAEQLHQVAGGTTDPWFAEMEALLGDATSLQDFADRLLTLYPRLSAAQFAEQMGQVMLVANLTGRSDLTDGIA